MTDIAEEKTTLNTDNKEAEPAAKEEKAEEKLSRDTVLSAQIRAAALAYARYLKENDLSPGDATFAEPEDLGVDFDALEEHALEAEVYETPEEPDDRTPEAAAEPVIELIKEAEEKPAAEREPKKESKKKSKKTAKKKTEAASKSKGKPKKRPASKETSKSAAKAKKESAARTEKSGKAKEPEKQENTDIPKISKASEKAMRAREKKLQSYEKNFLKARKKDPLAAVADLHDRVQDGIDGVLGNVGKDIIRGSHSIASTYRNTRRTIGIALLFITVLAAVILIVFDMFTVYEYAYNGKVLGFVQEQEEVTDVLDVAGRKLSSNSQSEVGVQFVPNQNVTFNPVDGRGKSTDDSDTVINKLIYMTDIETEAYAVYDGDNVVAIVKDSNDAEALLNQTMTELSTPDAGMELVSANFINKLDAKPVNVLLGSVQSNAAAQEQMVNGGEMETYHIVEEGETAESIADMFGVEVLDIYDEENSGNVTEIEQGDKVCIRNVVEPVSVKMVETGKIKETVEYETIKKETDKYYKGDSFVEQEGSDGVQIFEGTITKVAGEVTKRDEVSIEVIKKKKDKIILVGTAERPKTAATGTFQMPIERYVVTSEWGGRWGRMHEGMDFGASSGTPIYASDGGKVIRAGWFSGHGLCVEIDHGNNVVTRYSHCSSVLVNVGDLVYQGQQIAKVGNTGHSFGSHLHFEVRVNGSSQNPRKYINP